MHKHKAAALLPIAAITMLFVSCAGTPKPEDSGALPGTAASVPASALTEAEKENMELDAVYRLLSSGDAEAAIPRLAALAEAHPGNRSYPVLQGSALLSLKRFDEARAILKAELASYPDNGEALYALAELERFAGDAKAHRAAIESILAKDPKNVDAQTSMGDIWYEGKNYKKAEESYSAALAADPAKVEALIGLGRVMYRRDDMEGALVLLDKAVAAGPDEALAYLDRSRVLYQLGRYADCEADMDTAIRLAPDSAWNYLERGRLYLDTGRGALAIADFTKSIELAPDYFLPYVYRGGLYEQQGKDEAALADYRVTTTIYPDYWYAFESMGVLCYRLGLWQDAFDAFNRAAGYTGAHKEYYVAAALCLMKAGDVKAAKEYAGKSLAKIDKEKFPSQWLMLRVIFDQTEMTAELELRIGAEKNKDVKAGTLFYLGTYWLAKGKTELGLKYVRMSWDEERVGTIERRMAESDLRRMSAE